MNVGTVMHPVAGWFTGGGRPTPTPRRPWAKREKEENHEKR